VPEYALTCLFLNEAGASIVLDFFMVISGGVSLDDISVKKGI
jgi:hypothetical protein